MSDLYPVAGILFFLMFTLFILGDIAVNVAEFKCPGFKSRYLEGLPTVKATELPEIEGTIEKTSEEEESMTGIGVEDLTWEETEPGVAGMCDRWKLMNEDHKNTPVLGSITGFFVWACDEDSPFEPLRGATERIGEIGGSIVSGIRSVGVGLLNSLTYAYMIIAAISSPCAGIGIVSSLILFPILVTLLIFIFRIIRGS